MTQTPKAMDSVKSGQSSHFQLHQRFAMEQHGDGSRNDTRLCVQILGSGGF